MGSAGCEWATGVGASANNCGATAPGEWGGDGETEEETTRRMTVEGTTETKGTRGGSRGTETTERRWRGGRQDEEGTKRKRNEREGV